MLEARTVAVVGASPRPGSFGAQMLGEVIRSTAGVRVLPVNPRYESIDGLACAPSLAALDAAVDLVLLGVPNAQLESQLGAATAIGARSAVVFASGYEPARDDAPPLVARLAAQARAGGMAVCGGNCMGFWHVEQDLRALGFTEAATPPRGPVTFLSHSGSAFSALLRNRRGIGFNLVVSAGQEFVTSVADYLRYAIELDSTRVVAILMETARDPEGLRGALLAAADADIPVVALKVGRSGRAKELVTAHSGALAGEDSAYQALFEATGTLRVDDLDELMDTVELLASGRRAGRGGLAAVHDSGAERALLVDVADAVGVPFAPLAEGTRASLAQLLDPGLEPDNPLDVWGTGSDTHTLFAGSLGLLAADPGVAAVALSVDLVEEFDGAQDYVTALLEVAGATDKPVVALSNAAASIDAAFAARLRAGGVPVLHGSRSGLLALRHLLQLADLRAGVVHDAPAVNAQRQQYWRSALPGAAVSAQDAARLLADYGVPVVAVARATTVDQAREHARRIGYPVVLKTDEPEYPHKSDVDGVRVGLADETSLVAAYDDVAGRLGPAVSVSAQADGRVELALGIVTDPQLGPVVVLAAGGVLVELLADSTVALPPLDRARATAMVDRLRSAPLLGAFRGQPAVDTTGLVDALLGLSQLAVELGDRLLALDVNPMLCGADGCVAVDCLVVPARQQ